MLYLCSGFHFPNRKKMQFWEVKNTQKKSLHMKIIERPDYLESLQNVRLMPDIKVVTGVRRAGKSELIRMYMEWLRKNDKKANIIFIDFTSLAAEPLQEYHALHNYIEEQYKAKKNN